jgi:endonuclease YncB( thermonuclease family)
MRRRGPLRPGRFPFGRLRRARSLPTVLVIAVGSLLVAWRQGRLGGPRGPEPHAHAETAVVARVEDGDTIRLGDGRSVRYLGIDAPERGEPFYDEATRENRRLVEGRGVELLSGGPEAADRYDRVLSIIRTREQNGASPVDVNASLVRAGLASVYLARADSVEEPELSRLLEAQGKAITERKGVWSRRLAPSRTDGESLVSSRLRIHRASCPEVRSHALPEVRSLEAELRLGKSPCRSCKPLD